MQLQKLEDELGLVIFDRSKSPILATPRRGIIDQARAVVRKASRLLASFNSRRTSSPATSGSP
jgi:LysR family hydrogen peroxide-inducible transcriptional activator